MLGSRYLRDHLVHVHPHHGIGFDQLLKFDEHRMEFDVIASGFDPLSVSGEP
jgi:hypothetical protein